MTHDILTEHKLLILYFLSKSNVPISSFDINDFLIENDYTNFLQAQEYFGELSDSQLISYENNNNKMFYKITQKGIQTLSFFIDKLSEKNKLIVLDYFKKYNTSPNDDVITTSFDYASSDSNNYTVNCKIIDGQNTTINVNLNDISLDNLEHIKNNLENNKDSIIEFIKNKLFNN